MSKKDKKLIPLRVSILFMFIGLALIFALSSVVYWNYELLPRIRNTTRSSIIALSQIQAFRLETYITSHSETLTPKELKDFMGRILLLKDSQTNYQFLVGIRLVMDYDTFDLPYHENHVDDDNCFDISASSFICNDCVEAQILLYSTSTKDLIGSAFFTINSQFINYIEKNIQISFLFGIITMVAIISICWWLITLMIKPFSQLAFHLQEKNIQSLTPLPQLSAPKTKEIHTLKVAMDYMLSRINEHQEILEQTVKDRTIELQETIAQMKIEVETRIRAEQEAIEANQTKSQFLANMSHEIRTPLNTIIGFSELLKKDLTQEKHKNFLTTIVGSGNTLLTLINDILDLSKIEAGKLDFQYTNFSLRTILQEMSVSFSPRIKAKGLSFHFDIDPDLPETIILDEVRIRQILFNLIGNAVKFTKKGSVRIIVNKRFTDDKKKVTLIIGIHDTGVGIPLDQQKIIFEAFRQQSGQKLSEYGGTGLGLAITERLIKMMNGTITVKSELNKGSVFEFELPDVTVASSTQTAAEQSTDIDEDIDIDQIVFDHAKILIVDDIMNNLILMESFLEDFNFQIDTAMNGLEAIEKAKEFIPDLIFMDIKMPVMDGLEATQKLKNDDMTRHIPIIIISASAMKGGAKDIVNVEHDDYLTKPVRQKTIIESLKKFIPYTLPLDNQMTSHPETVLDESINIPPELIKKIRPFEPQIMMHLAEGILVDEIEQIANEIKAISVSYNFKPLIDWADDILSFAEMFDIEQLSDVLKKFSIFIKII
jgi:signal transduction histidine kinase/CheY-like chemotaxis protein